MIVALVTEPGYNSTVDILESALKYTIQINLHGSALKDNSETAVGTECHGLAIIQHQAESVYHSLSANTPLVTDQLPGLIQSAITHSTQGIGPTYLQDHLSCSVPLWQLHPKVTPFKQVRLAIAHSMAPSVHLTGQLHSKFH